ncbi:MAG: hypothetical protein MUF49_04170 [Oculatellaceae cyanobacterium Prado106]|nr:hypothetical protein [Oculatellaceae cyanobacterium Prado106]
MNFSSILAWDGSIAQEGIGSAILPDRSNLRITLEQGQGQSVTSATVSPRGFL